MPARLSVGNATISTPDGELAGGILVRNGSARITQAGKLVATRDGVVAVDKGSASSGQYQVRFLDGAEWIVTRVVVPCGSCR